MSVTSDTNKRYYWLKLSDDFFRQKEIKQLRRIAGGNLYTIIYLKMLLCSMDTGGKLYYEGISDDFASELALDIDEEIENVRVTIQFLISKGILIENTVSEYELTTSKEMVGSECGSARRMRKKRAADALAAGVPLIASHCDSDVTTSDTEIDIEIDTDTRDRDKSNIQSKSESKNKRFTKPTVEEIRDFITENHFSINPEDFYDYYESNGWMVGRSKMKDWKATVRRWERNRKPKVSNTPPPPPPKVVPKPVQAPTPPAKDEEPKNVRRQVTLKDDDNRLVGLLYEDGEIVVIRKEGRFTHADVGPFGMKRINISGYRSVKRWEDATCDPDTQLSDFFP